jgi:hypothetical protein
MSKIALLDGISQRKNNMYIKHDTIKCPCGKTDTGLDPNGFLYCPPAKGVKCPHCGRYIFPPKATYPYPKPKKPYYSPWNPKPDVEPRRKWDTGNYSWC